MAKYVATQPLYIYVYIYIYIYPKRTPGSHTKVLQHIDYARKRKKKKRKEKKRRKKRKKLGLEPATM